MSTLTTPTTTFSTCWRTSCCWRVLRLAAWTSSGGWRRLYLHLLRRWRVVRRRLPVSRPGGRRTALITPAALRRSASSASLAWMAAAAMSAREWDLHSHEFTLDPRWRKVIPQLAMLALFRCRCWDYGRCCWTDRPPLRGSSAFSPCWARCWCWERSCFLRQYFQDQALMALLQESRRGYESQKRLQTQLVQKEKLASLGNLVAGAAHEIDHPLTAIMSYSEQLWAQERLTSEQNKLLRKIVNQARRTRDLVADLLSFAQQAPGEKILVDLSMLSAARDADAGVAASPGNIRVGMSIAAIFRRCRATPTNYFRRLSRSSRMPWTRWKNRRRRAGNHRTSPGQRGRAAVFRHWRGHSRAAAGFRSLLHDQAGRKRYRPRPERRVWRDPGTQRSDHLPEQARRRSAVHRATSR